MEMVLDWRSLGSLLATVVVFRTALHDFLPPEAEALLRRFIAWVAAAFRPPRDTILIDEADGPTGGANDLYDSAQGARCLATAPMVRLHKPRQSPRPVASLPDSHTTHDTFRSDDVQHRRRRLCVQPVQALVSPRGPAARAGAGEWEKHRAKRPDGEQPLAVGGRDPLDLDLHVGDAPTVPAGSRWDLAAGLV